jgi:UDP-N-acetyl-D-mannosaminuronic acid dehydrogenase
MKLSMNATRPAIQSIDDFMSDSYNWLSAILEATELEEKIRRKEAKVCIVGLGHVGVCLAAVVADAGFDVIGVDVSPSVVSSVSRGEPSFHEPGLNELLAKVIRGGKLRVTTDTAQAVEESDVILITVGTPIAEGEINLSYLKQACKDAGKKVEAKLIIIKSTVTPGTTEEVVKRILEEESGLRAGMDFALVYSPERMAEGKAIKELKSLPEIIGGLNELSSNLAKTFVNELGVEAMVVSNPRVAEMAKLADNLWIDSSIALANQLALICEKLDIDVHEVIKAANTLPRGSSYVNLLLPGLVGGSCLSKDPYFVAKLAEGLGVSADLILAVRKLNESMYLRVIALAEEALKELRRDLRLSTVAVLGLSFKGETSDLRDSQAVRLVRRLRELGATVRVHDPFVKEPPQDISVMSLEKAVKGADCVIVATEHSCFKRISLSHLASLIGKPCALVDARAVFNPAEARRSGFVWRGLGRA